MKRLLLSHPTHLVIHQNAWIYPAGASPRDEPHHIRSHGRWETSLATYIRKHEHVAIYRFIFFAVMRGAREKWPTMTSRYIKWPTIFKGRRTLLLTLPVAPPSTRERTAPRCFRDSHWDLPPSDTLLSANGRSIFRGTPWIQRGEASNWKDETYLSKISPATYMAGYF